MTAKTIHSKRLLTSPFCGHGLHSQQQEIDSWAAYSPTLHWRPQDDSGLVTCELLSVEPKMTQSNMAIFNADVLLLMLAELPTLTASYDFLSFEMRLWYWNTSISPIKSPLLSNRMLPIVPVIVIFCRTEVTFITRLVSNEGNVTRVPSNNHNYTFDCRWLRAKGHRFRTGTEFVAVIGFIGCSGRKVGHWHWPDTAYKKKCESKTCVTYSVYGHFRHSRHWNIEKLTSVTELTKSKETNFRHSYEGFLSDMKVNIKFRHEGNTCEVDWEITIPTSPSATDEELWNTDIFVGATLTHYWFTIRFHNFINFCLA